MDRMARRPGAYRCRPTGGDAVRRPRRHRPHRDRTAAGRAPRSGRRGQPRQVAIPRDGQPRNSHAAQRHHRHERIAAGYAADAGRDDLRPGGKTSGDALLSLIEELLDYSKIEAGKIDLEHRPFALAGLIEDITELLAPRATARKMEIAAYIDEGLASR